MPFGVSFPVNAHPSDVPQRLLWLCVCFGLLPCAFSNSSGAPASTCATMTPGHPGVGSPVEQSPVMMIIATERYVPFEAVQVKLEAKRSYAGFLIQARNAENMNEYVGYFEPAPNTKFVCGLRQGLTHTSPTLKDDLTFTWRAPVTSSPNVIFRLTVVENYKTYFIDIKSSILRPAFSGTTKPPPTTFVQTTAELSTTTTTVATTQLFTIKTTSTMPTTGKSTTMTLSTETKAVTSKSISLVNPTTKIMTDPQTTVGNKETSSSSQISSTPSQGMTKKSTDSLGDSDPNKATTISHKVSMLWYISLLMGLSYEFNKLL